MTVAATNPYNDLGLALQTQGAKKEELGQQDFLLLMTTQLPNQYPFKPMESGEFLSQIAPFSTVSGIQQLNAAVSSRSTSLTSGQALQAAALVGRSVMVPSTDGYLPEEGALKGAVELEGSGKVVVDVHDASGQKVVSIDLGTQEAGLHRFEWSGADASGTRLGAGTYELRARVVNDGKSTAAQTLAVSEILSVTLGGDGLSLELQGLSSANLTDVRQYL